jgi:hypothetical protein
MRWGLPRPGRWVTFAVLLGLALRSYHYLRCPPVWHDEAALIVNVLKLSFAEMLGPLLHAEASPPLFLWLERAVVLALGESEYALRLVPFLASCLALMLFARLARQVLGPHAAALAVGLFAVSDRLLWHASEAKPYALDVLVGVAAAWWFARTVGWPLWRRCLPVAVAAPVALWVSYPACFVCGGLLLGLLPSAVRRGAGWRDRLAFGTLAFTVGAAFVALALGPAAVQRNGAMDSCWVSHFPDWSRPWSVPVWAAAGTFEVARYCLVPVGQVAGLFVLVGAVALWRRGGGRLVVVLTAPLGLALVAALMHKYPFGGSRLEVFAAPMVCLLSAEGVRRALPLIARRTRAGAVVVLALALAPVGQTAYRAAVSWHRTGCDEAALFVLRHRGPTDRVLVNSWEYEYYLRSLPGGWRSWAGRFEPADLTGDRVWVVHTDQSLAGRFAFPVPDGWEVAGGRAVRTTLVVLLRRTASGG